MSDSTKLGPSVDSPRSATSSDDDAVNSSTARVYFGPLQSPERKFSEGIVRATPLRKSARLSSIILPPSSKEDSADEAEVPSRSRTPVDEDLPQDEPSIVLASKIMRAHDNPSPPPSFPHEPATPIIRNRENSPLLIHFTESPPRPRDAPLNPYAFASDDMPKTTVQSHVDSALDIQTQLTFPQCDLITFDYFSSTNSPRANLSADAGRDEAVPHSLAQFPTATVDDLLAISPVRPPSVSVQPTAEEHVATDDTDEGPEALALEEDQVLRALTDDIAMLTSAEDESEKSEPPAEQVPHAVLPVIDTLGTQPQTPVRRSSRPRKSATLASTSGSAARRSAATRDDALSSVTTKASETSVTRQFLASPSGGIVRKKKATAIARGHSPNTSAHTGLHIGESATQDSSGTTGGGVDSSVNQDNQIGDMNVDSGKEKRRRKKTHDTHRRLGSLSPGSTSLLQQLLPSSTSSKPEEMPRVPAQNTDENPIYSTVPAAPVQPPSIFPLSISNPDFSQIQRPPSPIRSPGQFADPNRTPARRITITEAIAQGTFSQRKGVQPSSNPFMAQRTGASVGLLGSPIFKRAVLDDPLRSPARRVPISESMSPLGSPTKGKAPVRPESPVKVVGKRERSGSAEPHHLMGSRRERSASVDPLKRPPHSSTFGKDRFFSKPVASSSPTSKPMNDNRSALPFPIVAIPRRIAPAIPEEDEAEEKGAAAGPSSSPAKVLPAKSASSLRQPSAGAGSRIPRVGAKPYTKPPSARSSTKVSRLLEPGSTAKATTSMIVAGRAGTAVKAHPMRVVIVTGSSSDNNSDDSGSKLPDVGSSHHSNAKSTIISHISPVKSADRLNDDGLPKLSGKDLLFKNRVRTTLASVAADDTSTAPLKRKRGKEAVSSPVGRSTISSRQAASGTSISKEARAPASARRVRDQVEASGSSVKFRSANLEAPTVEAPNKDTMLEKGSSDVDIGPETLATSSRENISVDREGRSVRPGRTDRHQRTPSGRTEAEPENGPRRATRSHNSTTDLFSPATPGPARPSRRKHQPQPERGAFFGMSAVALKALTSSNTAKNQTHIVELHTEVVRKEGKRPESPTTKVRTVLERQREEKSRQRKERATRRARKSGEGSSDAEGMGDSEDMSMLGIDKEPERFSLTHRRGPGEEEDYETPPRPVKKGRFGEGEAQIDKRVKWDHGLQTTVWLDGSPPKPRKPRVPDAAKGCLANSAKALKLDTLGNLVNADAPLTDLVHENIIVKKFVYDDDDDDVEVPEPVPAAKSTRSKSKRLKA